MANPNPWCVSNFGAFLFYCCPECDFKSHSSDDFENHSLGLHPRSVKEIERMKNVNGMVENKKGHHTCKICFKYYTSGSRWLTHMKEIHNDFKPYKCEKCNTGFALPSDLKRHEKKIHQKVWPNFCLICEKTFATKLELKRHTHDDDNVSFVKSIPVVVKYECKPCDATFFNKSQFERHTKRTHAEEQSFECEQCHKVLKGKNDLKRHIEAVHEKKRPYMCSKCCSNFARKSYCKSHLIMVHKVDEDEAEFLIVDTSVHVEIHPTLDGFNANATEESVSDELPVSDNVPEVNVDEIQEFQDAVFKCLICKAVFSSESSWTKHNVRVHSEVKEENMKCDYCSKTFSNANDVSRHVKEVHYRKTYSCGLCSSKFSRRYNCREHLKKKHQTEDENFILDDELYETVEDKQVENLANQDEKDGDTTMNDINDTEKTDIVQDVVITGVPPAEAMEVIVQEAPAEESENTADNRQVLEVDQLRCDNCDFTFSSHFFMHQHFQLVHGTNVDIRGAGSSQDFVCPTCNAPFKSQESLNHHQKFVHAKETKPFLCHMCDRGFKSNHDLNKHIRFAHEGSREFACNLCDHNATTASNLKQHKEAVHEGKKKFKCIRCDKSFAQKSHLRVHIQNIHEKNKPFKCMDCDKAFSSAWVLDNHVKTRHCDPGYCNICHLSFTSKITQYKHHMTNHKDIPLDMDVSGFEFCDECGTPCNSALALRKHKYMHQHGEKYKENKQKKRLIAAEDPNAGPDEQTVTKEVYPCNLCGKVLTSKKAIEMHITCVHDKIKAFACHICGKRFGYKRVMEHHIATVHENNAPYPCEVCGKTFVLRSHMQKHLDSVHKKIMKFKCEHCDKEFTRKECVKSHIRIVHHKIKRHVCQHCGQAYGQQGDMNRHIRKQHGIEPVKRD